jgi:single-stranded-DNA-specific exonuclease
VVGIVASKVAERFWRPTVLMALEDGVAHGSGRTVGSFNLFDALSDCRETLLDLGGHAKAAGLSLEQGRLAEFREAINRVTAERWPEEDRTPSVEIDLEVALERVSEPVVREIGRMAPFGEGNRRPVLASRGLSLVGSPEIIGSTQRHVAFLVRGGDVTRRAVAFNGISMLEMLGGARPGTVSVAYEPQINDYRGRCEVELRVKDVEVARGRGSVQGSSAFAEASADGRQPVE